MMARGRGKWADFGGGYEPQASGGGMPAWVPANAVIHIDLVGGTPQGRAWVQGTGAVDVDTLLGADPDTDNFWGLTEYDPEALLADGYLISEVTSGTNPPAFVGAAKDALFSAGGATVVVRMKQATATAADRQFAFMSAVGDGFIISLDWATLALISGLGSTSIPNVANVGEDAINVIAFTFVLDTRLDLAGNGSDPSSDEVSMSLDAFLLYPETDYIQEISIYAALPDTTGLSELSDLS